MRKCDRCEREIEDNAEELKIFDDDEQEYCEDCYYDLKGIDPEMNEYDDNKDVIYYESELI